MANPVTYDRLNAAVLAAWPATAAWTDRFGVDHPDIEGVFDDEYVDAQVMEGMEAASYDAAFTALRSAMDGVAVGDRLMIAGEGPFRVERKEPDGAGMILLGLSRLTV